MTGLALVFPGQGSQQPGMGAAWRTSEGWSVVDDVSEATGVDVARLLLHSDAETLRRTDLAQLSVFALSLVALRTLRRMEPAPVAFAGHSLGEYTALVAAGALTVGDGARLVAERGAAMLVAARLRPGTMAVVVGAPDDGVAGIVAEAQAAGGEVWVANRNAPGQITLAGTVEGIELVAAAVATVGAKMVSVPVGGAFHSPLMAPATSQLRAALGAARFATVHAPVVSNVDAEAHDRGDVWPDLSLRQLTAPVRWVEVVGTLVDRLGCDRVVSVGPGKALTGMVRRIRPTVPVGSVTQPTGVVPV